MPKFKTKRHAEYYESRRLQQDHLTPSTNYGDIFDQDTEGPDEKSTELPDTTENSIDVTDSMEDLIDSNDSLDIVTTTEPTTTTSDTKLNLPPDFQEHKSIARSRKHLRHGYIEDFPAFDNNMGNLQSESKNWYHGDVLNGGNSNDRDILTDWRHIHAPKHGSHSYHETNSNLHHHHSDIGDNWQANDSSYGDKSYDEWSNLHSKGVPHHHNDVGLEDEIGKLHKKIHFGEQSHGIGGKYGYYSKEWTGHPSSKSWGGSALNSKQGGESHADSYGKWNGVHLEPTNWEGSHPGGTVGDTLYVSGSDVLGGSNYIKKYVYSNGGESPTHYTFGRSRSVS